MTGVGHIPGTKSTTIGKSMRGTPREQMRPSTMHIAWAAGIYEGEGTCSFSGTSEQVRVTQKRPYILSMLQCLFGGTVVTRNFPGNTLSSNPLSVWTISGARARGFMMTIYTFLSPYRREQIRNVLEKGKDHK